MGGKISKQEHPNHSPFPQKQLLKSLISTKLPDRQKQLKLILVRYEIPKFSIEDSGPYINTSDACLPFAKNVDLFFLMLIAEVMLLTQQ